jgi:hypothetical protein
MENFLVLDSEPDTAKSRERKSLAALFYGTVIVKL